MLSLFKYLYHINLEIDARQERFRSQESLIFQDAVENLYDKKKDDNNLDRIDVLEVINDTKKGIEVNFMLKTFYRYIRHRHR